MTMQRLNPKAFFNNQTAAAQSSWFPVDCNFAASQARSIMGNFSTSAADQVVVELLISATDSSGSIVSVTATATVWTGSATGRSDFSAVLFGPFQQIRVRKVGASAAVNVVGLV